MSIPNNVTELFSVELNELKIAPNNTAAKKPTQALGNTFLTYSGYALSALSKFP